MKASTRVKMAVLALAVCALVAFPAFAYGHVLSEGSGLMIDEPHKVAPHIVEKPLVVEHVALDPDVLDAILAADAADDCEDDGPFPDAGSDGPAYPDEFEPTLPDDGGDEMVPDDEPEIHDAGDDGTVSQQATPPVPTTPTVPRRPYLPYTGGNSLGWILAGLAVAAIGVAVAAWGYATGSRRAEAQ